MSSVEFAHKSCEERIPGFVNERILDIVENACGSGKYPGTTEAEREFQQMVETEEHGM
jgi:hypothetical protein